MHEDITALSRSAEPRRAEIRLDVRAAVPLSAKTALRARSHTETLSSHTGAAQPAVLSSDAIHMTLSTTSTAYAGLVLAAMSAGISTATTKYALAGFSASDLLVVELTVATLVVWSLPAVRRCARSTFHRGYLVLGVLEPGVAFACFNFGLERTSAAIAAVLVSLESVAIALLAATFLGERLSRSLAFGAALGVGGAVLLGADEAHRGASIEGDALIIAGVLAAAGYSVIARRLAPDGDSAVITAYQLSAGLAVAVFAWFVTSAGGEAMLGRPSRAEWVAAVATGVLGSAVPFLLYTFAVARLPASHAGLLLNLIPVFGILSAVVLLDEHLMVIQLLGAGLVVVGLGAAQLAARDS
jgi:drug/metabolite transporter (DMT)-like permease